ncbi:14-3-3 protein [Perkinsela sp. CCAP 1560/4]|nr:14-3-3 protein [Perkinsela sp. CCAP 1560/4]|eukprot:KNH02449.1 14-3-3 protein [Perkinsela sp. CCAP 1560/4]
MKPSTNSQKEQSPDKKHSSHITSEEKVQRRSISKAFYKMKASLDVIPLELVSFFLDSGMYPQAEYFLKKDIRMCRDAINSISTYPNMATMLLGRRSLKSDFRDSISTECISLGHHVLEYLDRQLFFPSATHPFIQTFLLRLQGDISRYLYECTNDSSYKTDAVSFYREALCLAEASLYPSNDEYLTLMAGVSCLLRLAPHKELHTMYEGHLKNLILSLDPFNRGEYIRVTTLVQLMNMNFTQAYPQ